MTSFNANYPKGVYTLFNLQALGMFAYAIVAALLTLYSTHKLGFDTTHAYAITAAFYGLVFATSVPGGYIAETFLGYKRAFVLCIFLTALGTLCMMLTSKIMLYTGLGLFLLGNGIFVPCIYVMLGQLFDSKDPRREKAFTLSYIGMNLGGFVAGIFSGTLTDMMSYSYVFLLATLITLSMLLFVPSIYRQLENQMLDTWQPLKGYIYTALVIVITAIAIAFAAYCNSLILLFGFFCIAYILFLIFQAKTPYAKQKITLFLILFITSTVFWALSALSYSALTIFTENNVHRIVFGIHIPTADFSGLNSLYIIGFGMFISYLWAKSKSMQSLPASLIKFAVGLLLCAFGFSLLVIGLRFANADGLVNSWWLILGYLLQALGELCIGPVGYAVVAKLVASNVEGRMMGIWQMGSGIGGALSYYFAKLSVTSSNNIQVSDHQYTFAFGLFAFLCALSAMVLLGCYWGYFKKKMK